MAARQSAALRRSVVTTIAGLTLATLVAGGHPAAAARPTFPVSATTRSAEVDTRPNIILFMTDDQNVDELQWMPKTRSLLGDHGITFSRAMSPAPSCCPARAMTATGQYGQNNGVQHNQPPYGGFDALKDPDNTLATWLQDAGYQTALVGKFLNGYQTPDTPPVAGWTRWNPSVWNIYNYHDTTFLDGDGTRTYSRNVTPVISRYTETDVRSFSATGAPFFIWVSQLAPHAAGSDDSWAPPIPTYKHADDLSDVPAPSFSKPSYNDPGDASSPYPNRRSERRKLIQQQFTGRIRSLQDADDALEQLVAVLRDTGEMRNTYIIFVSDNGMLLGEHRLRGKNRIYQEDLRVPLIVRPPGGVPATTSRVPVTTVDLAPTIAQLAGATPARVTDGQSFAPVLAGGSVSWRDTQLIQTGSGRTDGPEPGWDFRGVWTHRYTYARRSEDGAEFLFDRHVDPYELHNVAADARYLPVLEELRRRRDALVGCAGPSCYADFGPVPRPAA